MQMMFACIAFNSNQAKCYKYWEDELTKPLQLPNGISVQQDEHKIFAEYECRLFTVTHVSSFT